MSTFVKYRQGRYDDALASGKRYHGAVSEVRKMLLTCSIWSA